MKAGIVSFGAYVPIYRLSQATLSSFWGGAPKKGEKAVANWDEDSLTMASEAAIDSIRGADRQDIDGLYLATTTPAYVEKQTASILAKVLDLRKETFTTDVTDSLRGGTLALKMALDAINAGTARKCMVVASDSRLPAPDSGFEALLGDGAAALVLGKADVAVEIEGSYGLSSDFIDVWKKPGDDYMYAWEDRFVIEEGYVSHVKQVVSGLFSKYGVSSKDFTKLVLFGYDARRHAELAQSIGFSAEQVQDHLQGAIGHTGTASVPMMLVAALEDAKAGDRILVVNYGDGADAFILRATPLIEKAKNCRGIKKHMASKLTLPSYGKYVHFRNLMRWEARIEPPKLSSMPMSWRDRDWILSCKGCHCKSCDHIMFPPQKVCSWCQGQDNFEPVRISDKKGVLFSYSLDNLAVSVDPPTVNSLVDLEGGGRFGTIMTDRDPAKLSTAMPVELTFRRFSESRNMRNYFWKCRPVRA